MADITFITNAGKRISVPENTNLLRASIRDRGGIPFKCGGGLCGTCRCRIEQGLENTDEIKAKERKHLTEEEFASGYRMACQTFVNGDISVSWIPLAERTARPGGSAVAAQRFGAPSQPTAAAQPAAPSQPTVPSATVTAADDHAIKSVADGTSDSP